MVEILMLAFMVVSMLMFLMILNLQRQVNNLRHYYCETGSFLHKLQREHQDLRRQFLQLEIDFIVLQERSK